MMVCDDCLMINASVDCLNALIEYVPSSANIRLGDGFANIC